MKRKLFLSILIGLTLFNGGCGTRVLRVSSRQPVMLAEDVDAYIYVKDSSGTFVKSDNRVMLQAGSVVTPDIDGDEPEIKSSLWDRMFSH